VDEISDLNNRLVSLQHTKDQDREMFEQQMQQIRNEHRGRTEQLNSDNMMLSTCFTNCIYLFFTVSRTNIMQVLTFLN